jgi:hypothetical protein
VGLAAGEASGALVTGASTVLRGAGPPGDTGNALVDASSVVLRARVDGSTEEVDTASRDFVFPEEIGVRGGRGFTGRR